MKYNKWKMKRIIEKAYANAIKKLIQGLQDELKNLDSPFLITSTIKSLARQPTFIKKAEALAKGMITQLFSDNVKSWRQAANKGSQGKMIYKELQKGLTGQIRVTFNELINQNANYISSLPLDIAKYVDRRIAKGVLEGKRATDIRDEILRYYPHISETRAQLIARTETSKAQTALTRVRAQAIGLNWYVWRTSEDSRVRKSHSHMEGVLINFNYPPSPERLINKKSYGNYNAGDIFNCRCYPEPLIDINDIKFPHKVYYGGTIRNMTKNQFLKIM